MTDLLVPTAAELLDRITDGFVAVDRDWRITYLNAAAQAMAQRPASQLIGKVIWEEYPDIVGTPVEVQSRRALAEQVKVELENHYPPLGLWTRLTIYPSPSGLSIYAQDITARKRAEQALADSEARSRLILDTANEGIWMVDPDYRTTFVNPRLTEILGTTAESLIGRRVQEFVMPEDLPLLGRQIEERRQGRRAQYDIRMRRADGQMFWALVRVSPILDPEGRFNGAVGMLTDITDRKLVEQEVQAQREWFRVTLSSIGDAVIATDTGGRVTFMNDVAVTLTGWSVEEARGRPLGEVFRIVNEQSREPVEDPVQRVLREGQIVGLANHTALISRDGSERPIDDSGAPIRDGGGAMIGVVLVFRDNSEKVRSERALLEADRRKDEFLALLAHELRNPLAPIRSTLDVLRLSADQPATVARARQVVERQVEHMTRLVDDLLDVSRITRGLITLRRERVELGAVVARAVETVAPLLTARRQRLETELPEEPVVLDADPVRIAQVLANLLNNASKFTPEQGRISLLAERRAASLVLRVRDEGCGITADSLPIIFEPFRQGSDLPESARGGLGLGLTLVRSLVELHGGRVGAHSAGSGCGSELIVELPVSSGELPSAPPASPRRGVQGRIVVVDDNVDAAESLAELLSLLGHRADVVFDGATALERIRQAPPDLVLLDLGMPGLSGYEVAARLRAEPGLAALRIVALTGYGQEADKQRARAAGFDEHLVKPVHVEALQEVLARLLGATPSEPTAVA